jgi:hypothetical protein
MAVDKDWRQKILVTSLLLPLSPLSVLQLKKKEEECFSWQILVCRNVNSAQFGQASLEVPCGFVKNDFKILARWCRS